MARRMVVGVVGIVGIALAAFAAFQRADPGEVSDVLLRVNGPLRLAAGDSASTVVVVGHDADIEGTIGEQLVVIGGTARVAGTVRGNLVVVNGRAVLGPEAAVGRDVVLHESTLERAPGARVGGVVRRRAELEWGPFVGWVFWLSLTLLLLAVGLVVAAVAGRQLFDAAARIRERPGPVVLTALLVAIGLPLLAFLAFVSLIGIPMALLIVFFLMPALALVGVAVTGTWLGAVAVRRWGGAERYERSRRHPYLAVTLGVVALQIVALIPILGGLVLLLASQLGAGALVYRAWRVSRERAPE
ncbi:MAG TPA: polymer-forming cytoskeletal protein [Longimicrobiales bacterium]